MTKNFGDKNLKNALIDHAESFIQTESLDAFSLRNAARDLGVSPGAAYRHFKNKNDLLEALAARGFDQLSALMEAKVPFQRPAKNPIEARGNLEELARIYVYFARDHASLWHLMFSHHGLHPRNQQPRNPKDRPESFSWLHKSLNELSNSALPLSQARAAWFTVHGLADLASKSIQPIIEETDTYIEIALTQITRALP